MAIWKYIKFENGYIPIYENKSSFEPLVAYEWALVCDVSSKTMNDYAVGDIIYRCNFSNGNYFTFVKYSASQARGNWYLADGTLWGYISRNIGVTYSFQTLTFFHYEDGTIFWNGYDGRRDEFDPFSTGAPAVAGFNKSSAVVLDYSPPFKYDYRSYFDGILVDPIAPDPYTPGGESGPGGGTGDFDGTSTPVDIPELPSVSASDTGFISLFNPTMEQLQELSNYMWSDLFDVEGWKKIFANPMDAILGLSLVPVSVPGKGSRPIKVGNISTGVTLTVAATQYVSVDCGTINVNEYWGAYLDYDPYTKAEIYLPYIGTHAVAVDDIMGKAIHIVYHVDILSGACCAYVKCGESVLYTFVGQCSCSIPITGSDWTNVINGALSIAGAIGSMVATGGASAPMAIGAMASAAVNSLKPNVEKSGSMGGMGGMLGIQVPYLILTRPRQALPLNQNHYTGYPSFITVKLGDCQGYTEIESVHLEGIPATQAEISEIEILLKGGVIF